MPQFCDKSSLANTPQQGQQTRQYPLDAKDQITILVGQQNSEGKKKWSTLLGRCFTFYITQYSITSHVVQFS